MVKRWTEGLSHFPGWAEGPSCETEGIPERTKIMFTKNSKWNLTTELCIDLKTILRSDRRARIKKDYTGVLTRDGSEHFTFLETLPWNMKRNPKVFNGKYISVTRRGDGSLRPNFKPLKTGAGFKVERYALGVYNELCMALEGLIEEN